MAEEEQLGVSEPAPITGAVRVLIVDPEDLFRRGLAIMFEKDPDVTVVGQARTGQEALELARDRRPTVVLTELGLPDMTGLALARMTVREMPDTRIALIARSYEREDLVDAARAGVHGYLTKDITLDQLVDAVKRVSHGQAFISPGSSAMLIEELAAAVTRRPVAAAPVAPQAVKTPDRIKVTEREREVLQLIVQGATNRDIARRLLITENTVKVHLRNILDKLHLRNRQQAAAYAVSSGLVEIGSNEEPHNNIEPPAGGSRGTPTTWRQRSVNG